MIAMTSLAISLLRQYLPPRRGLGFDLAMFVNGLRSAGMGNLFPAFFPGTFVMRRAVGQHLF